MQKKWRLVTIVIVIIVIGAPTYSAFEYFEYLHYPFPPELFGPDNASEILGLNFTLGAKTVDDYHTLGYRVTYEYYFQDNRSLYFEILVFQCASDGNAVSLFQTLSTINGSLPLQNVTHEGNVVYMYSNITSQGVDYYSIMTGYLRNTFLLIQTDGGAGIPKDQMLTIFNEQMGLVNATNPNPIEHVTQI